MSARDFATDPAGYFGMSWHAMQHVDRDELAELQLAAARLRFAELRDQIPTLAALAGEQGITELRELDDLVPLLFQHSVYKSYPASLLVGNQFGPLTKWLDRLTTHDLSGLDVADCDSIDAWLDRLDAETPLRVAHSSGTTGTMSFYPRGAGEWDAMMRALRCGLFQFSDPENTVDHEGEWFELVWPLFRQGRAAITRFPDVALPHIMGSEDRIHALRPGRLSSDGMFLAGRLAAADARGETDALELGPALAGRRDQFVREQQEMQQGLPHFVTSLSRELEGRRVWLLGTFNTLYGMARAALDAGLEGVFAPDSL
ncbi:MAG: hypothetical protein QOF76_758, partial [Solirubrobacteraceae bacterium]|nr:hypothetical protein [Solirubrobacteraceae bacterium]